MASSELICAVCGANNPANIQRCRSCGAKLESLSSMDLSEEEERARRMQQDGFEWKWVFIAFAVYVTLQAIFLFGLRFVIATYDPQGLPGLLISAGVWFVGGILVGAISPGKTFLEPTVAALLAVIPTIAYLMSIADVYQSLASGLRGRRTARRDGDPARGVRGGEDPDGVGEGEVGLRSRSDLF